MTTQNTVSGALEGSYTARERSIVTALTSLRPMQAEVDADTKRRAKDRLMLILSAPETDAPDVETARAAS